ncbi:unnamed protein product, partial [Musa textilis]
MEVRRFVGSVAGTGRERVGSLPKGFRKFVGRFVGSSRSLPRKIGACQRSSGELTKIIMESERLPGVRRMVSEGSSED